MKIEKIDDRKSEMIGFKNNELKPDEYHVRYREMLKKYCVCCATIDDDEN